MGMKAGIGSLFLAGLLAACSTADAPREQVSATHSAQTRPENCDGYGDQIECPVCGDGEECYVAKWAPGPGLGCGLRACRTMVERPARKTDEAETTPPSNSRCDELSDECSESTDDCDCQPGWGTPEGSREMCRINKCATQ